MRKNAFTFICLCFAFHVNAQVGKNESFQGLLNNPRKDTTFINSLLDQSYRLLKSRPDTALLLARKALDLSERREFSTGEIKSLCRMGSALSSLGSYSIALEHSLNALRKSEKNQSSIPLSLLTVAQVYHDMGDDATALKYLYQAKDIREAAHDELGLAGCLINIGLGYQGLNQLDSARIYINRSLEISLRLNDSGRVGATYLNMANINRQMSLFDIAKSYFQLSHSYVDSANHYFLAGIYDGLSDIFDSTGKLDSAFYYARLSMFHAKALATPSAVLTAAEDLASLFKKNLRPDSAVFYQDIVIALTDSLISQEKAKQIQNLTFNEQVRQADLASERVKQNEERKRNLQIAGVAIFIPLFFGFVLLLSRKQIRPRAIEFLGILFLLFVFEFITLFSHPFIGKWTHESPIWMLLIFVAIALVLVPLHHRSENWIKKQLVLQRKKALQKMVRVGQEAQKRLES